MTEKPEKKSALFSKIKKPAGYFAIALLASIASVAIYAGVQFFLQKNAKNSSVLDNPLKADSKPNGNGGMLRATSESFRKIAKVVGPAVVNIRSTKGGKKAAPGKKGGSKRFHGRPGPGPDDEEGMGQDPFFQFFERFGMPFQMPQDTPQTSLGSGILIDKKGIVVTNNHVVEDANEILINLSGDKTDYKAKALGTDPKTDLAVLKIEGGKEFPYVEWSDSDAVEVGDWAIAIGSPFALGQSVTVGIVSAKGGRNSAALTGADYGGDLIQTDAAINPGNSGGPLCDLDGHVMGVNTAIYTRSGGYMGIGFAIPSNLAKDVVGKLISEGKIVRGWLGVLIQPLDNELAKELGIKEGVGIHEVLEGSPAAEAGLKAGDVVINVEGKDITEVNQLQRIIAGFKPGQSVKMKVVSYADKKTRNITVKIGKLPDQDPEGGSTAESSGEPDKLGLVVSVSKKGDGVVVESIQPGSIGDQVGIEPGDVIVRVNRQPANSIAAYKKQLSNTKRLYLEVKRKGRTLFFQFGLPE